jgi:hypothetical protein
MMHYDDTESPDSVDLLILMGLSVPLIMGVLFVLEWMMG